MITRKNIATKTTYAKLVSRFIATLIFIFFSIILSSSSHASPVIGFDAGHIIDDTIFTNNYSMNVSQIQTFLNSKVSNCDTNGTQPASDFGRSDITHAQYAASRGWPAPPYTCLKDYTENGINASQIIYNAAQEHQINPQVLIVLLQKEQGLVTDSWPLPVQYRSATGYGCPDTAPCDSQYYGLTNQIQWSAHMFRAIFNNSPTWYTPYILGNNFIQYSPNGSCGGTTVDIQNRATQSLYNYTPYQPNQAALNAGYGSGDSCSAHGNRNFYLYFNDWFGSTYTPSYSWGVVSVVADRDTSKLVAGEQAQVTLTAKNTGNRNWYNNGDNPIRLATNQPINRRSIFKHSSWIESNRPTVMSESQVAPGETATFIFWLQAPANTGNYTESFNLVAENLATFNDPEFAMGIGVLPAVGSGTSIDNAELPTEMDALDQYSTTIKMRNDTNTTWRKTSIYPTQLLVSYNNIQRTYSMQEETVQPGETATFNTNLSAPSKPGNYVVSARITLTNLKTFDGGITKNIVVTSPPAYTDELPHNDNNIDFNGDSIADIAVWNASSGIWNSPAIQSTPWGSQSAGDVPVPGDYDGDGKTDIAVWRKAPGLWFIIYSSDSSVHTASVSGKHGSLIAVPGDYDGDGKTDIAVWDYLTGNWNITQSSNSNTVNQQWGSQSAGDVPVPGDYDGDGKTDIAVWRKAPGMWFIRKSSDSSIAAQQWGSQPAGDVPVPGDYDGDGKTDIAVWRKAPGFWFIRKSSDSLVTVQQWGSQSAGDVPVPGDYDGDGKTDIAVWRAYSNIKPNVWYILKSSNSAMQTESYGDIRTSDINLN